MKTKNFEVLDCTLRDGGYYTNWDFDDEIVERYLKNIDKLPVDIIEIGYRSMPEKDYKGKYFYLPDFVLVKIEKLNISKEIAIMFNEKSVIPEHLDVLLPGLKPVVSIIRLAVNPENFDRAVILAKAIKDKGFDVTFNMMYMSKYYKDEAFLNKLSQADGIVRYLNLVDSYGGLLPNQVKELVEVVKSKTKITLGYHGHNNLELGMANSLVALEAGCEIVDGTITGMGRGAGNLKTELLLTHLVSQGIVDFDFNALSALVEEFEEMQKHYGWGTNLPYMVSGANSLPQSDVMEWVTQRWYSFNSIIRALHIQKAGEDDNLKLSLFKPEKNFKYVIIIGGGLSAVKHAEAVKQFIKSLDDVCIVHASSKNAKSYEDVNCKQFYCLVGNEGHRLEKVFNDLKTFHGECILPPFPRKMGTYIPEVLRNNSFELEKVNFTDKYKDAHTSLALQTAIDLQAEFVYLVGYDGYNKSEITSKEQALISENEYLFGRMINYNFQFKSLLKTNYTLIVDSIYAKV
ncbi:MAG: aldolase catalytic domain-containing protein [Bacteroidetes bacterium]|nr:aldolase catalytic domain-containing protein [Bacteroidota bacterium]